jgi:hypothetical protein
MLEKLPMLMLAPVLFTVGLCLVLIFLYMPARDADLS